MDREDRFRAGGDRLFHLLGVQIIVMGIDIYQNRPGARMHDRFDGGEKRVWAGDHLVSFPHPQRV